MSSILAFKLYGNFHWPPTPEFEESTPEQTTRKRACIEIRYAPPATPGEPYRAYLVWVPEHPIVPSSEPTPESPSLYELSVPHDWFKDEANANKPIWIDGPASAPQASLVSFRGAFLFEQYRQDRESIPELRWPLVPEYKRGKTAIFSALTIKEGSHDGGLHPRFDFDLSLPLPVKHADDNEWAAFPLRAVYYPQANTAADVGQMDVLVGRGFRDGAPVGFVFNSLPDRRLGKFDLAAAGPTAAKCAVYSAQVSNQDLRDYWPASNAIANELLEMAGLAPVLPSSGNLPVKTADAYLQLTDQDEKDLTFKLSYRAQADRITLKALHDIEAPLQLPGPVHVDISLEWVIPDRDIWTPEAWTPQVAFRLIWNETLRSDDFSGTPPSTFARRMLVETAGRARNTRESLPFIEGLQPASILPVLKMEQKRTLAFVLRSARINASCMRYFEAGQGGAMVSWSSAVPVHIKMTLAEATPESPEVRDNIVPKENHLPLKASLPGLIRGGAELSLSLRADEEWAKREADSGDAGSPHFASFALKVERITAAGAGRIGSLMFTIPQTNTPDIDPDFLRTAGRSLGGRQARRYGASDQHLNAMIRLTLPVSQVTPISTDVARTDRSNRPAPLLIEIQPPASSSSGPINYYLQATETFGSDEDRLLTVSLLDKDQETKGDRDYLLLAEEPYSILRFRQKPLGDRGNAASSEVAIYSSDDRVWQYRIVAPLYHFMLPPQAIGESADKPHRLELHDLSVLPEGGAPPLPYVKGSDKEEKVILRHAVEFRLTPSTDLWVHPSDVARGYFIPEQASNELFRQRGEYGLGAALAGLRSEFLYGLSVSVDVGAERSAARFARVAEIGALTGGIVGAPREQVIDEQIVERWNKLSRAISRRPERLELWARDPDSPVDFSPARFTEGTRFALRSTALHCPPLAQAEQDKELHEAVPGQLRIHEQGLRGGALWPIESLNLFSALKARPDSQGGTLEQVALAPFGGDATQKAEFLNGIVKILSETRNGFVERQKIEVMGRIGALWHRAKHVVVYERTVNPSAQFAPSFAPDKIRSRRPILRKVSEYIELLQPERLYPDFPQAQARSTGFLDRVRFNSRIINVDSAWGSDVGTYGWQVPLWNRAAARERPQVYGMPDIAFVTVAEGEGESPLVAQECEDADLLFFFADFQAGTSDTDLWQARLDIDYANLPLAHTVTQAIESQPEATSPKRRPAVSRIMPGARRFTWRLAPAARKTAINAGRAQTPIYVGLESVSFMRAAFVEKSQGALRFQPLGALLKTARDLGSHAKIGFWESDQPAAGLAGIDTARFTSLIKQFLSAPDDGSRSTAYNELTEFWAPSAGGNPGFAASLGAALASQAERLATDIGKSEGLLVHIEKISKDLPPETSACQTLASNAISQLRGKSLLVRAVLQQWQANLNGIDVGVNSTKEKVIGALLVKIRDQITPIFNEASDDIGDVRAGVEKAREILRAVEADAEDLFSRAYARLDQLEAAYDHDKPWSAERRRAFRADYRTAVSNLTVDIAGAIDEARQRLSIELSDFAQSIASHLGRSLALIASQEAASADELGALNVFLRNGLAGLVRSLDELSPGVPPAQGKLERLLEGISAAEELVTSSAAEPELKEATIEALRGLQHAATQSGQAHILQARNALEMLNSNKDVDSDIALAGVLKELADGASRIIKELKSANAQVSEQAQKLLDAGLADLEQALLACWQHVEGPVSVIATWVDRLFDEWQAELVSLDFYVKRTGSQLRDLLSNLLENLRKLYITLDTAAAGISTTLDGLKEKLAPKNLLERVVIDGVVKPALQELLAPLPDVFASTEEITQCISALADQVARRLDKLDHQALGALEDLSNLCKQVHGGLDQVENRLRQLASQQEKHFTDALEAARQKLDEVYADANAKLEKKLAAGRAFDHAVRNLQNDLSRTVEAAQSYGDRLLAAAGRLGDGNLMATPSNVLKLYSAVTSAPALAGLKADIERIRADFDDLSDIIDITEANALLNRLGDELKSLGISFPYDRISDRLLPASLAGMDLGKLFCNIGGANLVKLFKGEKLSDSVRDAIRLTHDFDRKQARAWVKVDIDAPLPGRRTLFSIGPFQCDFVDMRIVGQMRLDASKDSEELNQTGYGRVAATLDMVVSGQSMVSFEKFALNFSREDGLKIDFDPNHIRLNPAFQFVQDALLGLFPDALGPMTVIKENGIPVGLEHEYALPVMSANAVTSGISNISIENRFRLIAHPDFVLSDRFSLSRPERPFIFSLFILGGTGFVQIETEYRPFDDELTVTVDAAAGASALLGISAGPFSGQVFITLSAVLTYRKMLGRPGGGLAVSALLVIAGNVDVMGIATVGIYVALRLAYRDNGQIDADGTLSVTIKISRFFSITARAGVQYRLRNGHAQTRTSSSLDFDADPELKKIADKAVKDARKIQRAMV